MSEHFYVCPMLRETGRGTPFLELGLEIVMSLHVDAETRALSSGRAVVLSVEPSLKTLN